MLRIVVADDEIKVCNLICALIEWETLGLELAGVAHNGLESLELIKTHKPDIVITDIRMPGIDGIELIKLAKEIKSDLRFIIISGYKQFEYAQSAIKFGVSDYLLKPLNKNELNETLKKIVHEHEKESSKILSNDYNKLRLALYKDMLFEKSESEVIENIDSSACFFQCFAVKLDCDDSEYFFSVIKILSEKIIAIMRTYLQEECNDIEFALKESSIYCIMTYGDSKKDLIRKKIKQISDEFKMRKNIFEKIEFTIGLGEPSSKLFNNSLSLIDELVCERLIAGNSKIIEKKSDSAELSILDNIFSDFEISTEKNIELLNKEKISESVNDLKNTLKSLSPISGVQIFNSCIHAYESVCSRLKKYYPNENFDINISAQFKLASSIDNVFGIFIKNINEIIDKILQNKEQENIRPIRIAKQYINDNYMNQVNLEEIAGMTGFNSSYFSSLFKKETGENFLTYLTKVRIDKAKQLLKETNINISEICTKVGYTDLRHFTQAFKKYAGIKPNEYRKLYS